MARANRSPLRFSSAVLTAAWALTGCEAKPSGLVPVVGTVTVDNRLLVTGTVSFRPDAGKGNANTAEPAGAIGSDGRYKLMTAGREGAPPGWYKVYVVSTAPIDPANPYAPTKSYIDRKYSSPDSGLAIEVVANPAPGAYDLPLTK